MKPYLSDPDLTIWNGDALAVLSKLPAESAHMAVTSPPFFGLRNYNCGGQIGLEATPEEWVARLVAVFDEVKRVLRSDGTLWVECGDSYVSGQGGRQSSVGELPLTTRMDRVEPGPRHDLPDPPSGWGTRNVSPRFYPTRSSGLKPKDLLLQPFRLAQALQAPRYLGKIADERDRVWLAAMVDAEGCIHVHRRPAGQSSYAKHTLADGTEREYVRKRDTYSLKLEVSNVSEAVVERCEAIAGVGSITSSLAGTGKQQRRQTLYRWNVTGQQAQDLLTELYPYLIVKQHQTRVACGKLGAEAHEAIKLLHNGGLTDVDAPVPASLYVPGWYLRNVCIWAKSNPMPESVRDRFTVAHSYVLLFSKSPRYFFDAEAVRESFETTNAPARNGAKKGTDGMKKPDFLGEGWFQGLPNVAPQDETLDGSEGEAPRGPDGRRVTAVKAGDNSIQHRDGERWPNSGRNARSVWTIPTEPLPFEHYAAFPQALAERCIKAGTSERGCCPECGAGWVREVESELVKSPVHGSGSTVRGRGEGTDTNGWAGESMRRLNRQTTTLGWRPSCECPSAIERLTRGLSVAGASPVVLDPFLGSGTTALVSRRLGRRCVGIELNADYCALAARRTQQLSLEASA